MAMNDAAQFEPSSLDEWHQWLAANHLQDSGVWVVVQRRGPDHLSYDELVREALCWGWVDGQSRPLDESRSQLWFTHRKPSSPWAASNKARVAELEAEGRLQPEGLAEIERAKRDGRWTLYDSVDALIEPDDLAAALDAVPAARATWDACPPGVRKAALTRIVQARRQETKSARIADIVARTARGERPA
ncbi:MAG: YdeI/OmpD-associated family protein [Propionibacteriaceae bacterium]|nr:YdeI/OmpD-associated family protein [Propionibacteriaceae bacterium]